MCSHAAWNPTAYVFKTSVLAAWSGSQEVVLQPVVYHVQARALAEAAA